MPSNDAAMRRLQRQSIALTVGVLLAPAAPFLLLSLAPHWLATPWFFWGFPLVIAAIVFGFVAWMLRLVVNVGPSLALGIPAKPFWSRTSWRFAWAWNPGNPVAALRALARLERGEQGAADLEARLDKAGARSIVSEASERQRRKWKGAVLALVLVAPLVGFGVVARTIDERLRFAEFLLIACILVFGTRPVSFMEHYQVWAETLRSVQGLPTIASRPSAQ